MKKNFAYILLILCLLLSGCSATKSNVSEETTTPSPEASVSLEESSPVPTASPTAITDDSDSTEELKTPVREYGESTAYIQMEEDLVVRILYPERGRLRLFVPDG